MNKVILLTVVVVLVLGPEGLCNTADTEAAMHAAFQNTRRYQLTTYSYSLAYYDSVISNVFAKFLNTYSQSAYCPEIQNTLTTWVSERDEVAKGSIKYNKQWYQGDAAKTMLATIQVTQLIAEGDRQLQAGKYDLAIGQFQKALQQRPLTQETLGLIETKCESAFAKWTASVPSAPSNPEMAIQAQRQTIQQLQQQIQQSNGQIAQVENDTALIASAVFIPFCRNRHTHTQSCPYYHKCPRCGCIQGHWISGERDFGNTLPTSQSLATKHNLMGLRNFVSKAQGEIAKAEAAITTLQSGGNQGVSLSESIQKLQLQLKTEIAGVRASLFGQPAKMEVASAAVSTGVSQQSAGATESVQPTQSQPQVRETTQETSPPPTKTQVTEATQETSPPTKQPWWKEFWWLILIGVIGAVYILRH